MSQHYKHWKGQSMNEDEPSHKFPCKSDRVATLLPRQEKEDGGRGNHLEWQIVVKNNRDDLYPNIYLCANLWVNRSNGHGVIARTGLHARSALRPIHLVFMEYDEPKFKLVYFCKTRPTICHLSASTVFRNIVFLENHFTSVSAKYWRFSIHI